MKQAFVILSAAKNLCFLRPFTAFRVTVKGHFATSQQFHDHIIRDEREYQKIWQYIDENPMKWEEDCYYIQS